MPARIPLEKAPIKYCERCISSFSRENRIKEPSFFTPRTSIINSSPLYAVSSSSSSSSTRETKTSPFSLDWKGYILLSSRAIEEDYMLYIYYEEIGVLELQYIEKKNYSNLYSDYCI